MAKPFSGLAFLAGRLEASRREKGLSYSLLAKISGVDVSQVHRICRGRFRTLSHNVVKICNVLQVEPPEADLRNIPGEGDYDGERLVSELFATWDHTSAGADRLVDLLLAVRRIQKPG